MGEEGGKVEIFTCEHIFFCCVFIFVIVLLSFSTFLILWLLLFYTTVTITIFITKFVLSFFMLFYHCPNCYHNYNIPIWLSFSCCAIASCDFLYSDLYLLLSAFFCRSCSRITFSFFRSVCLCVSVSESE